MAKANTSTSSTTTTTEKKPTTEPVVFTASDYELTDGNHTFSPISVLSELTDIQASVDQAQAKAEKQGLYMVAIAQKAGNLDTFLAVMASAELTCKMGTPPAGTSPQEKLLWSPAPQVYRNYKSMIKRAWENGIEPGHVYDVPKITKDAAGGELVKLEQKAAATPTMMNTIAKAKAKEKEREAAGAPAADSAKDTGQQAAEDKVAVRSKTGSSTKTATITVPPEVQSCLVTIGEYWSSMSEENQKKELRNLEKFAGRVIDKATAAELARAEAS